MTIRAYQEIYLNKAQKALGNAFDYAINICEYNTVKEYIKDILPAENAQ